jgi:hypothetical protein
MINNKYQKKESYRRIIVVIMVSLSFIYLFYAFLLDAFRSDVNPDAGYYLGVVELINKGFVPYRDFALGYTPVSFYVLQVLRFFMDDSPNYSVYKLFLVFVTFSNAFLFWKLSLCVTNIGGLRSSVFAIFFLLFWYFLEGNMFVLEHFSVFFGLCSLLFVFKDRSFINVMLSGVMGALSFLTKQYGLIFMGCIGIYLLFFESTWKSRFRQCAIALLGFCATIGLFLSLFWIIGVSPSMLIKSLGGTGYGQRTLHSYKIGFVLSVKLFPFLLLLPCLFIKPNRRELSFIVVGITGIVLSSFQFFFNVFLHYYLFMLPFVFLLVILIFSKLRTNKDLFVLYLLLWGMIFTPSAFFMPKIYKSTKHLKKVNVRSSIIENANDIKELLQQNNVNKTLCYMGTIQYYGLCSLIPAEMEKYGFSFGLEDTEERMCERLLDTDCFIVSVESCEYLFQIWDDFRMSLEKDFYLPKEGEIRDIRVFLRNN